MVFNSGAFSFVTGSEAVTPGLINMNVETHGLSWSGKETLIKHLLMQEKREGKKGQNADKDF